MLKRNLLTVPNIGAGVRFGDGAFGCVTELSGS